MFEKNKDGFLEIEINTANVHGKLMAEILGLDTVKINANYDRKTISIKDQDFSLLFFMMREDGKWSILDNHVYLHYAIGSKNYGKFVPKFLFDIVNEEILPEIAKWIVDYEIEKTIEQMRVDKLEFDKKRDEDMRFLNECMRQKEELEAVVGSK